MVVEAVLQLDELLPLNMIGIKKIQGGALEVSIEPIVVMFVNRYKHQLYLFTFYVSITTGASPQLPFLLSPYKIMMSLTLVFSFSVSPLVKTLTVFLVVFQFSILSLNSQ